MKNYSDFKEYCLNTPIKLHRKPESLKNYEAVFIDFREIPHSKFVITNCINKLSKDWSHTIVCGPSNYNFMKKLVPGVKVININKEIKNVNDYNNLLLSIEFWDLFYGSKILIYQEDTLLFHGNITPFLKYDYIGAPWVKDHIPGGYGGNGGLSLRTKSIMKECLMKYPPPPDNSFTKFDKMAEDLYFCNVMHHHSIGTLAPRKVGVLFSQEQLISDSPMGGHKFWDARDHYEYTDIPLKIPSVIQLDKTKIPRHFIQTFRDDIHVHRAIVDNIKGILSKNKGFDYRLITDSIGVKLIESHFGESAVSAFKKLKAGAAKGDFMRYIVMYIYGGVYLDMDAYIVRDISEFLDYNFVWIYDNSYNISQWFFMISPKNIILKEIIDEMITRIQNNEQNIFLATGPTLVSDVIFSKLTKEKLYNTNKSIPQTVKKDILESNNHFMDGLFLLEDSKDIVFTFPGYQKEMMYNPDNPRYVPVFNGGKSPDLYN